MACLLPARRAASIQPWKPSASNAPGALSRLARTIKQEPTYRSGLLRGEAGDYLMVDRWMRVQRRNSDLLVRWPQHV